MSIEIVPHLNFRGEARIALEFYQTVFGGTLTIATYEDLGNVQEPGDARLVIWGQVAAESGFKIMAFDATSQIPFDKGQNAFYVAARFGSNPEIKASWEKLTSGGSIRRDLAPAPWGEGLLYGMVQDKFGIVWVLDVNAQAHAS